MSLKNIAISVAEGAVSPPSVVQMCRTAIVRITGTRGSADNLDRALMIAASLKKPWWCKGWSVG